MLMVTQWKAAEMSCERLAVSALCACKRSQWQSTVSTVFLPVFNQASGRGLAIETMDAWILVWDFTWICKQQSCGDKEKQRLPFAQTKLCSYHVIVKPMALGCGHKRARRQAGILLVQGQSAAGLHVEQWHRGVLPGGE